MSVCSNAAKFALISDVNAVESSDADFATFLQDTQMHHATPNMVLR